MEEYSSNQSRKRTHSSSDEDTPELNNENSNNIEQSGKHPKRKLESSNIMKEDIGKGTSLADPVNATDSSKSGIKEAPSDDTKLNLSQTRRSLDSDSDEEHFNDDGYVP